MPLFFAKAPGQAPHSELHTPNFFRNCSGLLFNWRKVYVTEQIYDS